MEDLINNVTKWGIDKGIIGVNGTGTIVAQTKKANEEMAELTLAVGMNDLTEIIDGIGDTIVTLILLADMYGLNIKNCLQSAYNEIAQREGKMINGSFVKDK